MNSEIFTQIVEEQIDRSKSTLITKAAEYATTDRLHNFKVAAELQGLTPRNALAGLMAKHTVSLYDMCGTHLDYPMALWDEKITDHINYLLLLSAIIRENTDR